MRHGSLFSGGGGFDLAAEWMGWENVFHCEINPFGQHNLKYYWPNAKSYTDIKSTDFHVWRGKLDIITGGFPCQPFSNAGKREGTTDDRFLWPEMFRAIRQSQPTWVVAENVPGILTIERGLVFEQVFLDLEGEGYAVQSFNIPAVATDKDHRRDRIWFVAYNEYFGNGRRQQQQESKFEPGQSFLLDTHTTCVGKRPRTSSKREDDGSREQLVGTESRGDIDNASVNYDPDAESQRRREAGEYIGRQTERVTGFNTNYNQLDGDDAGFRSSEIPQFETTEILGGNIANSVNPRLQGDEQRRAFAKGTRASRPTTKRIKNEHWLEAATRLCVVDDGLPGRLDGITVSKWRTESLKLAGNAIVPDVAFEIFKSIANV